MPFSLHYIGGYLISTWFITADVKVRKCLLSFTNAKVLFTPFCSTVFGYQSWSPCCTKTKLHLLEGEYLHVLTATWFYMTEQHPILWICSHLFSQYPDAMQLCCIGVFFYKAAKNLNFRFNKYFSSNFSEQALNTGEQCCVPLSFCFLKINSWIGFAGSKDKHIFKAFNKHN